MDKSAIAAVVSEAVRNFVKESVPGSSGIRPEEVEAVVRLCLLGIHRDGTEDPRAMAKIVSDPVLQHLIGKSKEARAIPAMAKAFQFLLIEWCFRNDYLEEDWLWEWEGNNSGNIRFNAKMPFDMIPIPSG